MISIRDYSNDRKVSYETVRRQVLRYENELENHITKQNRTRYLDEWAVQFLDEHRKGDTLVIHEVQEEADLDLKNQELLAECERLKNENTRLLQRIVMLQDELIDAGKRERVLLENLSKKPQEESTEESNSVVEDPKQKELKTESGQKLDIETFKAIVTDVTVAVVESMAQSKPETEQEQEKKKPFWKRIWGK